MTHDLGPNRSAGPGLWAATHGESKLQAAHGCVAAQIAHKGGPALLHRVRRKENLCPIYRLSNTAAACVEGACICIYVQHRNCMKTQDAVPTFSSA